MADVTQYLLVYDIDLRSSFSKLDNFIATLFYVDGGGGAVGRGAHISLPKDGVL